MRLGNGLKLFRNKGKKKTELNLKMDIKIWPSSVYWTTILGMRQMLTVPIFTMGDYILTWIIKNKK